MIPLLATSPDLLDVVAQLVWVAAPERDVARASATADGLVRLLVDAPLTDAERRALDAGLDALLREAWARERGVYVREVRDRLGAQREVATPVAPGAWQGGERVVGPFDDAAAARRWRDAAVRAPSVGDVLELGGRVYVDVFSADDDLAPIGGAGL